MKKTTIPLLYLTIAERLRAGIESREWKPGDLLPSEAQLCREFGVSRGTVVKALDMLIAEGLATRRQGVGTCVLRPAMRRNPGYLASFSEAVRAQNREPSQHLIEERTLSRSEALQFGCGEPALLLVRTRFVDGSAAAIHRSIVPMAVAEKSRLLIGESRRTSDPDFSLYEALEIAGFLIDHAHETLNVRIVQADEAKILGLKRSAPVMLVHHTSYDCDDRLLESSEAIYPGENYTYEISLARRRSNQVAMRDRAPQQLKI